MKAIVTHPITGKTVKKFEICTNGSNLRFFSVNRNIFTYTLKKWPSSSVLKMLEESETEATAKIARPYARVKATIGNARIQFQFILCYEVKTPAGDAKYLMEEKSVSYDIEVSTEEIERILGSQLWRLDDEEVCEEMDRIWIKENYRNHINPLDLRQCFEYIQNRKDSWKAVKLLRMAFDF